ncbi:MAG: universal stress protein [Alphaproteobacteria bacterium]
MYRKILAATDGSESGTRAVELAGDLAKIHGAEITLIHVINPADETPDWLHYSDAHALGFVAPPVTSGKEGFNSLAAQEIQRAQEQAQVAADRLIEDSRRSAEKRGATNVRTVVEQGPTAERILITAKNENADVIVIGNRGHGNFKGLLIGSVSSAVAKDADCYCISVT